MHEKTQKDLLSKRNDRLAYRAAKSVAKMSEEMSALDLILPEPSNSYDSLTQSLHQIERTAADCAKIRERWASQIRPYYILDMMGLGNAIEKYRRAAESLRLFAQKSGLILRDMQSIARKIQDFNQAREHKKTLEKMKADLESASAKDRAELEALASEREILMKTPLMAEIAKTDEELKNLRATMIELAFRRLIRPLKKLEAAAERGDFPMDNETRTALQRYLKKPYTTFLRESPEIPKLKTILSKLREATFNARISVKKPERRKVEEKFRLIVEQDRLKEIYKLSRHIIAKRRELTITAPATDAMERYRATLRRERALTRALKEITNQLTTRQKELGETHARLESISDEIANIAKSLTGRRIEVAA